MIDTDYLKQRYLFAYQVLVLTIIRFAGVIMPTWRNGDAMRIRFGLAILAALAIFMTGQAHAWDPIAVEVGKSRIVRLKDDQQPAVVFVGNPSIADVIIEREGVLFVLGRQPGETDVWILDDDGKALMHRPLVVTAITSRHITIQRGGAQQEQTMSCNPRCTDVPTPRGGGGFFAPAGQAAVISNPPEPKEKVSTEELIESLKELIPELAENKEGGNAGSGGDKQE